MCYCVKEKIIVRNEERNKGKHQDVLILGKILLFGVCRVNLLYSTSRRVKVRKSRSLESVEYNG